MSRPDRPWYHAGLRFECSTCGNCCSGPSGTVYFSKEEGRAMAEALGIDEQEFRLEYVDDVDGQDSLSEVQTSEKNYDCVFLDRESQPGRALCKVYTARPRQCRTWPFWPENLRSERTWYWVKRNTPCPGMDHGRAYSRTEIEQRSADAGTDPG